MQRVIARAGRMLRWLDGSPAEAPAPVRDHVARSAAAAPAQPTSPDRRAALVASLNPSHPIRYRLDLRGRDAELEAMVEAMLQQRHHAVVHGPRGSGKTSLVRIFAHHADRQGAVLIYAACEARASFADLLRPFFKTIPAANIPIGEDAAFRAELADMGRSFGPQAAVSLLSRLEPRPIIFILDEFDRVTDPAVQEQVATCMKLLSDALSPVQLLVVGIAQSVAELIACHPSLRRHVTAVGIGPIGDAEIDRLLRDAGERADLPFDEAARATIIGAACGSPYHARLFGYHAGVAALAAERDSVGVDEVEAGLRQALARWAGLNPADSALFRTLAARGPAERHALLRAAQAIARGEPVDEVGTTLAPLASALLPARGDAIPAFRDSTAPQFLVAALLLAEPAVDAVLAHVAIDMA